MDWFPRIFSVFGTTTGVVVPGGLGGEGQVQKYSKPPSSSTRMDVAYRSLPQCDKGAVLSAGELVDPLHIALAPIEDRLTGPVEQVIESHFAQNGPDGFHILLFIARLV